MMQCIIQGWSQTQFHWNSCTSCIQHPHFPHLPHLQYLTKINIHTVVPLRLQVNNNTRGKKSKNYDSSNKTQEFMLRKRLPEKKDIQKFNMLWKELDVLHLLKKTPVSANPQNNYINLRYLKLLYGMWFYQIQVKQLEPLTMFLKSSDNICFSKLIEWSFSMIHEILGQELMLPKGEDRHFKC